MLVDCKVNQEAAYNSKEESRSYDGYPQSYPHDILLYPLNRFAYSAFAVGLLLLYASPRFPVPGGVDVEDPY